MMIQPPDPANPRASSSDLPVEAEGATSGRRSIDRDRVDARFPSTLTEFDRRVRASVVQASAGRSPISMAGAWYDWAAHLMTAPGLQWGLAGLAASHAARLARYAVCCAQAEAEPCFPPLPQDKRFADPLWSKFPFNLIHQAFLMQEDWWQSATRSVPGVARHNADGVSFVARQILDQFAPSNFVATNPVVLRRAAETGGHNFWAGAQNFVEDLQRLTAGERPAGVEAFRVGETIACTPGVVVHRNEVMELIQYKPQTEAVHPEPILIVPAWIMKYYILDLSPANSMVRHLVEAGHTVFMISWRNPGTQQRDLGLDDYLARGVHEAIDTMGSIMPDRPIHAVGYCLGGTLLALAAAALGRRKWHPLKTVTLMAAQTDFSEAGELTLFIDESQVTFLEDLMWRRGFLEARQMAGAFNLLRSNDLIWSRLVRDYLLGDRAPMSDLMAWNADATRMPYRMHSEYLRRLFLNNELALGHYVVDGAPVALSNIDVPLFVVATEWDHVAPWKSVYKIHLQADVEITFALTTGGHNAGIVNPPEGSTRSFRIATHAATDPYVAPEQWLEAAPSSAGSWWPAWLNWLKRYSTDVGPPPELGRSGTQQASLGDAPGRYVLET